MANAKMRPFGTLAVAASAAALPMGGNAQAADYPVKAEPVAPVWVPHWYFSAEGGVLISDYSRSAFPDGLEPGFSDKFGDVCSDTIFVDCTTHRSGSLGSRRNIGWYGALSIGRDIDPVWDWRLSGSFNSFFPNRRSAAVNQAALSSGDTTGAFINTSRLVTETDRFRFATLDFDLGRKWEQGLLHLRAFGGFRALATDDTFNISDAEAKGLIISGTDTLFTSQANRFTQTDGRSHFFGIGPRIGVEGFYGTNWGVAGSASAAALPGWRYSTFDQASASTGSATICDTSVTPTTCVGPFTFNVANAANAKRSQFTVVGDLAASLGLAWRPTPIVGVEAGYRVEALLNVRDSFAFANAVALSGHFDEKRDVVIHGPYVKAVIRY